MCDDPNWDLHFKFMRETRPPTKFNGSFDVLNVDVLAERQRSHPVVVAVKVPRRVLARGVVHWKGRNKLFQSKFGINFYVARDPSSRES